MKTVSELLKKSFGWPLLMWFGIFLLWNGAAGYFAGAVVLDQIEAATWNLVVMELIGIVLKIWFAGYLFLVAVRATQSVQNVLKPVDFKASFVAGVRITCRFVFINLPLIILLAFSAWYDLFDVPYFFNAYTVLYLLFIIIPFTLLLISKPVEMSFMDGLWTFFKRNAGACFSFTFFAASSYLVWFYVSSGIIALAQSYSISMWTLAIAVLVPYFLLFYTAIFNAVLAGFYVAKINAKEKALAAADKKEQKKK